MKKLVKAVVYGGLLLAVTNLLVFFIAIPVGQSKLESQLEHIANQVAMDNGLTTTALSAWQTELNNSSALFLTYSQTSDAWNKTWGTGISNLEASEVRVQKNTPIRVTIRGVVETPFLAFGINVKLRWQVSASQIVVAQTYYKDLP